MSEAAIFWIIGAQTSLLLVLIGVIARMITIHTTQCQEWQKRFLVEHGELLANQKYASHRLDTLEARHDQR